MRACFYLIHYFEEQHERSINMTLVQNFLHLVTSLRVWIEAVICQCYLMWPLISRISDASPLDNLVSHQIWRKHHMHDFIDALLANMMKPKIKRKLQTAVNWENKRKKLTFRLYWENYIRRSRPQRRARRPPQQCPLHCETCAWAPTTSTFLLEYRIWKKEE